MPYRFLSNGAVETDTFNEALAWERRSPRTAKPRGRPKRRHAITGAENPWEAFCQDVTAPESAKIRKILALIKGRGQTGINVGELQRHVGDPTGTHTTGTIAGMILKAKKAGLASDDVIIRGPDKLYRPGTLLQTHDPPVP